MSPIAAARNCTAKVAENGDVTADGVVYEFAPDRGIDGMRLDERGNIWAAAGQDKTTGLFVVSPAGKLLLRKPMPEFSTNLCFGGPDGKSIYFTATTSVYRLKAKVAGAAWAQE
jgi:gluconolactonase